MMKAKFSMFRENITMSVSNIIHNKMRSFLTMLGIIIGVAAIIALITIVNGITGEITSQFSAMGTGKLTISATGTQLKPGLTQGDMSSLAQLDNVAGIAPTVSSMVVAKFQDTWDDGISMEGRNETYFRMNEDLILRGRQLNIVDMESASRVCIISGGIVESLFYGVDPLGQTLLLNGQSFTVVGILDDDANSDVMSQAMGNSGDKIIIPYTVAMRLSGSNYIRSVEVYVEDTDKTDQVVDELEAALTAMFNYRDDTYSIINMESLLSTMDTMISLMTALLAGIASISLLVGGIGIMNMMLVSVTERTTEIGLRKALGAEPTQIQIQFLLEAFILSILGGAIGAVIGIGISYLFAVIIGSAFALSWGAISLGVGFSATVGVVFGWTPARKASQLNPIDALRAV